MSNLNDYIMDSCGSSLEDKFGIKLAPTPSLLNHVVTSKGLKLSLSDIELIMYLRYLATQYDVALTCSVSDDGDFVFNIFGPGYDCKK